MKKIKLKKGLALCIPFFFIASYYLNTKKVSDIHEKLPSAIIMKEKHAYHLENSPFKYSKYLSKSDRKQLGLPPNAYNEQLWELTLNPNLGRPTPENIFRIQQELSLQTQQEQVPGDTSANNWTERGPNNIGGRTRAILFDPNDINNVNSTDDYTRVFAGSVSGGLWVNDDITDVNSSWELVTGLPDNISVTVLVADPNNSNIFYLGSGESYTRGNAVGSGIYKSTDGGVTWQYIFGGNEDTSVVSQGINFLNGAFFVNDIIIRDNNGVSEIYAAIGSSIYESAANEPFNVLGLLNQGLYKSSDNGSNWSRFPIQHANGLYQQPNDIELDINNNIWLATTGDILNNPGGYIYESTDGNTFTLKHTITNARRTEIEPSPTVPGTFWILTEVNSQADILFTNDNFSTVSSMTEPNDAETIISPTDFTRGQAFYDLVIEVDANNNLYVGGINLFKYNTSDNDWDQISKWVNGNGMQNITASIVHADQHAIVFRPNNNNHAVIGNDGGIYFSENISTSFNNANSFEARNKEYNVTQFYYGAIADSDILDGDDIIGGTQDNGTLAKIDATADVNNFSSALGGDGAYTEIDEADGYAIISFPYLNHLYIPYPSLNFNSGYFVASQSNTNSIVGDFVNTAELDKTLNILYTNSTQTSSTSSTNRIGKHSNLNGGSGNIATTYLTNSMLNSAPTALKTSGDGHTLYAGLKNGKLLKIDNIHTTSPTWNDISDTNFVGSISDIEFGLNENQLMVTFHNYGVSSIWYSNNQGTSWSEKEGDFPDIPVKCILMNPLTVGEEVIIGTDLGVWRTQNFDATSPSWVRSDNGMRAVKVVDLDLRTSDNLVLATTHGRGLFTGQFSSEVLNVTENQAEHYFTVFPTVSSGTIKIQSNVTGKVSIQLFNMQGKHILTKQLLLISNQPNSLILDELSSGMYLMQVNQETRSKVFKIVIK